MIRYYSVHNKSCLVVPFSEHEEILLSKLDFYSNNCFSNLLPEGNQVFTVVVISGTTGRIDDYVYKMSDLGILNEINNIWQNLLINYKSVIFDWQKITSQYLKPLNCKSGLYRFREYKSHFLILTENINFDTQFSKIFQSLDFLLTYLVSFEKKAFFHSSCAGYSNDNCFLFIGKSGFGKSTIAQSISNEGGFVVNDEKNLIFNNLDKYYVYPGPLKNVKKENDFNYIPFGICKKILLIHQSQKNYLNKIQIKEDSLFNALIGINKEIGAIPFDFPELNKKIVYDFIKNILSDIPVYELHFTKSCYFRDIFINFSKYIIQEDFYEC